MWLSLEGFPLFLVYLGFDVDEVEGLEGGGMRWMFGVGWGEFCVFSGGGWVG